ncbi:MAG: oligosaccharide flippase family protein [Bryobacterales bacterium]|nr:oligosaccharide flippase family protein [Bryobacterales bacterium]
MGAVSFGAAAVTSFLLTPFLLRSLGDASYGILSLAGELVAYSIAFDFGIRGALAYFVSRFRGEGKPAEADTYVRTAFWILIFSACVALPVAGAAVWGLPSLFQIDRVDSGDARRAVGVLLLVPVLNLPWSVPSAVLGGLRRYDMVSTASIIATIASGVGVAVTLALDGGIVAVATVQACSAALAWGFHLVQLRRLNYRLHLWPPDFTMARVRDILRFGSANLTMTLTQVALLQTDLLVIGRIAGAMAVARYTIGRYLGFHLLTLVSSMAATLPTAFTHFATVGDREGLRKLYLDASACIGAGACLLAAGIIVFGEPFIRLWVGPTYTQGPWWDRSDAVLYMMTAAMLVRGAGSVPMQYLFGIRRLRPLIIVRVLESVVHLAGSIVFVSWLGLAGVALVKLAVSAASHVLFVFPVTLRLAGIPILVFCKVVLIPMAATGAATAAAGLVLKTWFPPATWPAFFADCAAAGACGLVLAWTIAIPPSYRRKVLEQVRRIIRS